MKDYTLVLGASDDPSRYSYKAIHSLRAHGHNVVAIGKKETIVDNVAVSKTLIDSPNVDTVTLYLNPIHQQQYYNYILSLHPRRIIFNPGTENEELEELATANGIQPVIACTLVLLATGQY